MSYDIIIIGAGPGGCETAEKASRTGLKVLLVEKQHLGGVCLNWGCIPTKTLLHCAKQYVHAKEASQFGVNTGEVRFDFSRAMAWKQEVVETLRSGIAATMKKSGVEVVYGEAKLTAPRKVEVDSMVFEGDNVVIAAGSSPFMPPIPGADRPHVMTSKDILGMEAMPKSLAVIGGGVIGIEFASLFSTLGVQVEIIEMCDEILPFMELEQAAAFRRSLRNRIGFHLGCRVTGIDEHHVRYATRENKEKTVSADTVLLAVGRTPNVSNMSFEETRLDIGRHGIRTDEQQRTNIPGVYAIGDITGKSQLAHAAIRMGEVVLNTILDRKDRFRTHAIPWVVYSMPEIAGCGMTEKQAKESGYTVETASLPMRMSGRFFAENDRKAGGSVKIIREAGTEKLLGVHMFGGISSEIIWGAAVMIEAELRVSDIQEIVFPHPTVGEVIRSAMFHF